MPRSRRTSSVLRRRLGELQATDHRDHAHARRRADLRDAEQRGRFQRRHVSHGPTQRRQRPIERASRCRGPPRARRSPAKSHRGNDKRHRQMQTDIGVSAQSVPDKPFRPVQPLHVQWSPPGSRNQTPLERKAVRAGERRWRSVAGYRDRHWNPMTRRGACVFIRRVIAAARSSSSV